MRCRCIEVPFAGIGIFRKGPGFVWVLEDDGAWRQRFIAPNVIVSMLDVMPLIPGQSLQVWRKAHDRFIVKHLHLDPILGNEAQGLLTLVHRGGKDGCLGLAWTQHPLMPLTRGATSKPPFWWNVRWWGVV